MDILPGRLSRILLLVGLALAARPVAAKGQVSLAVVVAPGPVGPALKAQVTRLVTRPLSRQAKLVPLSHYLAAGRAAGLRPPQLLAPRAAVPAGRGAGAAYVLHLQGIRAPVTFGRRKMKRMQHFVQASLIDTASGSAVYNERLPLMRRRLPLSAAQAIVAATVARLTAPPAAEAPAPVAPEAPAAAPPQDFAAPAAGPRPGFEPLPVAPPVDVATAVPPSQAPRALAVRPAFRAQLGWMVYLRNGTLKAGPKDDPPCYCSRGKSSPVPFSRASLRLEFYPFAVTQPVGHPIEGLGLYLEGSAGSARTRLDDNSVSTNAAGGAQAGAVYRWVLYSSAMSPELQARLGYATFSFPLPYAAAFPGVAYRSPTVGVQAEVPVGLPELALLVRGQFWPLVSGYGGTQNHLGSQPHGGHAYQGELGLRFRLPYGLHLSLVGLFEAYSLKFAGRTALSGNALQYRDVGLLDEYYGGTLALGAAF